MPHRSRLIAILCGTLMLLTVCANAKTESRLDHPPKEKPRALIIDGQNNHDWKTTTPLLRKALESSGRFKVDVATAPPAGQIISEFKPKFADYDVVISNYNGERWPASTEKDF